MIEQYKEAIIRMVKAIQDENILKIIYSFIIGLSRK